MLWLYAMIYSNWDVLYSIACCISLQKTIYPCDNACIFIICFPKLDRDLPSTIGPESLFIIWIHAWIVEAATPSDYMQVVIRERKERIFQINYFLQLIMSVWLLVSPDAKIPEVNADIIEFCYLLPK